MDTRDPGASDGCDRLDSPSSPFPEVGQGRTFPRTAAFLSWWKDHPERAKCTLEQALGAYCSTFPGRLVPLLVELLEKHA